MIKWVVGIILVLTILVFGSMTIVNWAYRNDVRNANEHCAALGAEPHYTYRTRYICVTPDGRVVE